MLQQLAWSGARYVKRHTEHFYGTCKFDSNPLGAQRVVWRRRSSSGKSGAAGRLPKTTMRNLATEISMPKHRWASRRCRLEVGGRTWSGQWTRGRRRSQCPLRRRGCPVDLGPRRQPRGAGSGPIPVQLMIRWGSSGESHS